MRWLRLAECILLWCTVLAEDCPYPCLCFVNADEARTLTVDCRNQELSEIPLGVPPTTSHLDVSYNSIQYVRAVDLENLPALTYLQLHTNQIIDIESGAFQELSSLEALTLQNNLLMMLRPGTFAGLSNLQTLNLFNNYIDALDPEVFSPLENLVRLDLGFNSLESIRAGTFFNMSRLFNLDLSENFISIIDREAIGNLPFLRFLNLEGNQLQFVPTDAWVNVPFLHSLSLDRNPLECGCRARWLRQWFLDRSLRGPITCGSPPDLSAMDLLQLLPADFCMLPTASIMETDPVVLSEGMTLSLSCVTSGAPPPIITWSRQGMTFDLMNTRLEIEGNSLLVNDVIKNDSGRYFCSAASSAGTAASSIDVAVVRTENVTVPISIATVGDTAVLECDGDLPLSVETTWRFSSLSDLNVSTDLNFTGRFAMGERGELIVFDVQEEDMGRYECVLVDGVSLFQDLVLQAAPRITITPARACDTPNTIFTTTGVSIRLVCSSTGVPTPTVTWTTPDRGTVSGVGSAEVPLVPPRLEDSGQYTCRAENEIGEDVSVITVNVMAVLGLNQTIFSGAQFLAGETAILNCSFPNQSTIEFEWQRTDGRPFAANAVQTSDGTLILPDLTLNDISVYRCQAVLAQGQIAFLERGVAVFDPAVVTGGYPLPEVRLAVQNGSVALNCTVRGNPRPAVEWTFRNETIERGGRYDIRTRNENFTIRSHENVLNISRLELNDTGVYTCTTTNPVGEDVYSYFLQVQALAEAPLRPFFRHQPLPVTDVIAGETARLLCEARGRPEPTLFWFKTPLEADTPVTLILPSERVVISPEELVIFDVRPSDEGFYFCTAENELGMRISTFGQFNVWIPPQIHEGLPINYLVLEGTRSVMFPCFGTGDPEPDLNWLRGNLILPLSTKQRILPNGSLEIFFLTPDDAGEYVCRLANAAGEQFRTVNLIVRAIPMTRIDPRDLSPVNLGCELSLFCSDMGTRPEELEWLVWRRDGERLVTGGNVVVFPDTGELVLSDLQISDSGNYSCEISSFAGSSEAFVLLSVEDPFLASGALFTPLSVSSTTPSTQALGEGQTAQFVCIASPPPPPNTIVWLKDDIPLRNLKRITIDDETGGLLTIVDVRITDEGDYSCLIRNRIGEEASMSFTLDIATRPVITWPPEPQTVLMFGTFELRCKAFGEPDPQILWLHNDTELTTENCTTIDTVTHTLTVCNATASSAGWYSCLARNVAGTAEFSVLVTVLPETAVAPRITSRPLTRIIASGEPLILDCIAVGTPPPQVMWFKDGVILNTTCPDVFPGDCLLVDESAYIQDTRPADSGVYSCVAENSAGVSVYEVHVLVEAPSTLPIFMLFPTIVNQSAVLVMVACQAEGQPLPQLSWLNADFENISTNRSERIYTEGGVLFITSPMPEDSGHYICRAENTAGINQVAVTISIGEGSGDGLPRLFPDEAEDPQAPKFLVPPTDVSTYEGLPVVVHCSTSKMDDAFTVWRKNSLPLYQDDTVTIAANGSLIIQRSKVGDSGVYDCVAVSEEGILTATILVEVQSRPGPPNFLTSPTDIRVMSGTDFVLPCQPEVANEMPSQTWLFDGQPLPERCGEMEVKDDGSLHILQATPTSAGEFTCRLSNQYATVDANATVTVTDFPINATRTVIEGAMSFELLCELPDSTEELQIQWSMGSEPLTPSLSLTPFGGTLIFLTVGSALEGEYTCRHRDDVYSIFLEVLVPPSIVNFTSFLEVTTETAIILPCHATGNPRPHITWFLEGQQVQRSVAATPLHDGSLYLHPLLPTGQHNYTCVAVNEVGTAEASTTLSVEGSVGGHSTGETEDVGGS